MAEATVRSKAVVLLLFIQWLLLLPLIVFVCVLSSFCNAILSICSSFAIISLRKRGKAGPKVIILFPCSTQLSTKFILLINVKMPTIVGILTFISMIYTTSERLKARNIFICRYFCFNERLKFHA